MSFQAITSITINNSTSNSILSEKRDIAIVGGGLAGLISSILLKRAGLDVVLIEKKQYPFHRVCGEYISNEVVPFLKREQLFPNDLGPASIKNFQLTSTHGNSHTITLPLGGFGISRYALDNHLFKLALHAGVDVLQKTVVTDISKESTNFLLTLDNGKQVSADLAIGSFGKRSNLDKSLNRNSFSKRSPYLAVKYHIKTDHPHELITLHNFKNGYCGISKVEGNTFNLCYLSHRSNLKSAGNISDMENEVLFQNPFLKELFKNSDFLFDKPLTINEISFRTKSLFENGIIMIGDSAGMITPLCGNGMAMAIHSAKMLSDIITHNRSQYGFDHDQIRKKFENSWRSRFSQRLMIGRSVQKLFGGTFTSSLAVHMLKTDLGKYLVGLTHGKPF